MSRRNPSVVVGDILLCINHIEQYTAQLSFADFSTNFMVEACLYNIQIIGEVVNHLPDDVKRAILRFPGI
jgi:uncharacterized protein with HEPN domain